MTPEHRPENLEAEYNRRCRLYKRGSAVLVVGWGLGMVLTSALLSDHAQNVTLLILQPNVLVAFVIFASMTWRCPVCRQMFTKSHRAGECEHCHTVFKSKTAG